jgi:hypothetical protein
VSRSNEPHFTFTSVILALITLSSLVVILVNFTLMVNRQSQMVTSPPAVNNPVRSVINDDSVKEAKRHKAEYSSKEEEAPGLESGAEYISD